MRYGPGLKAASRPILTMGLAETCNAQAMNKLPRSFLDLNIFLKEAGDTPPRGVIEHHKGGPAKTRNHEQNTENQRCATKKVDLKSEDGGLSKEDWRHDPLPCGFIILSQSSKYPASRKY